MINPDELRDIATFTDACVELFNKMCSVKNLEVLFDEEVTGGYTIARRDGTPLGKVQIVDSGDYEFVPEIEKES